MEARLAGGSAVAVELELLWCGDLTVPPAWYFRPSVGTGALRALGIGVDRGEWMRSPVGAYLVRHPSIGTFLIDTGVHSSVAKDLRGNFGTVNAIAFRTMRAPAERSATAQLRKRGIAPEEIERVVMTHLHVDHASGMAEFPNAEFTCSAIEWEAANSDGPSQGYWVPQLPPVDRMRQIDFADAQPHGPFERSVDLIGDGSVRMLYTPGHTRGHVSLLLRLANREVLVIGDALYTLRNMHEDLRPLRVADGAAYDSSVAQIRAFEAANPDALLIPTHDGKVWEDLYGDVPHDVPWPVE